MAYSFIHLFLNDVCVNLFASFLSENSQNSCKYTTQHLPILLAQSTQAQQQQQSIICGKYKDIEVICYDQIGMSILLIHAAAAI